MWLFDLFKKKKKPELKLVPPVQEHVAESKPTEMPDLTTKTEEKKPEAPKSTKATSASANCIKCIFDEEGFRSKPYLDVRKVPTIGYGTTYYPNGKRVTMSDPAITKEQSIAYAIHHINTEVVAPMLKLIKVDLNQNQFDALVSLIYNIGIGHFKTSTVLKRLNVGDFKGACDAFMLWNMSDGKPVLTSRRKREMELFMRAV